MCPYNGALVVDEVTTNASQLLKNKLQLLSALGWIYGIHAHTHIHLITPAFPNKSEGAWGLWGSGAGGRWPGCCVASTLRHFDA